MTDSTVTAAIFWDLSFILKKKKKSVADWPPLIQAWKKVIYKL